MVELLTDPTFTVFSNQGNDVGAANDRFDRMLALAALVPYAKQPVVDKASGRILGYTGVGPALIDGVYRLEWGWRLEATARGKGYATEAAAALLQVADGLDNGEMLCIIDPSNEPSRRVAEKLGFRWWRHHSWPGSPDVVDDLLVRQVGAGGPPLLAPELPST